MLTDKHTDTTENTITLAVRVVNIIVCNINFTLSYVILKCNYTRNGILWPHPVQCSGDCSSRVRTLQHQARNLFGTAMKIGGPKDETRQSSSG